METAKQRTERGEGKGRGEGERGRGGGNRARNSFQRTGTGTFTNFSNDQFKASAAKKVHDGGHAAVCSRYHLPRCLPCCLYHVMVRVQTLRWQAKIFQTQQLTMQAKTQTHKKKHPLPSLKKEKEKKKRRSVKS